MGQGPVSIGVQQLSHVAFGDLEADDANCQELSGKTQGDLGLSALGWGCPGTCCGERWCGHTRRYEASPRHQCGFGNTGLLANRSPRKLAEREPDAELMPCRPCPCAVGGQPSWWGRFAFARPFETQVNCDA
jgi:hypothetical protein